MRTALQGHLLKRPEPGPPEEQVLRQKASPPGTSVSPRRPDFRVSLGAYGF